MAVDHRRSNPDHRVILSPEVEHLLHDARVSAQPFEPESVAQHGEWRAIGGFVFLDEESPDGGSNAENIEVVCGYHSVVDLLIPLARPPHDAEIGREPDIGERCAFALPRAGLQNGSPIEVAFRLVEGKYAHESIRSRVGQRSQQDGVDDAENQSSRGDTQSQDQDDS